MKSVMIGGFIVSGQSSKFVVRAIGPSLAAFGITGTLSDPTLAVKNADGVTRISNDDWQQGQPTEIQKLGLAPTDPRESALLVTLGPGQYTRLSAAKPMQPGWRWSKRILCNETAFAQLAARNEGAA